MAGRVRSASRWGRGMAWVVAAVVVASSHVPGAAAAPRATPTLLLQPATAVPGQTILAKGKGFTPSVLVTVDLDGTVLGTVTASLKGNFVISLAVPASTLPGPHTVTATDPAGVTAQATLTTSTPWAGFRFDAAGSGSNPYENVLTAENAADLYQAGALDFIGLPSDTPGYAMVQKNPGPIGIPTLFFGTDDGVFHATNLATGAPLWTFATGGPIESSPALTTILPTIQTGPGGAPAAPAKNPGPPSVVFGSDDGTIRALDQATGELKWSYATGGPVRSSPTIAQIKQSRALILVMFVGSDDGNLYAIDATTGTLKWSVNLGAPITASPAVLTKVVRGAPTATVDEVLVGTEGGMFEALNAANGQILWSQDLGAPDHFSSPALVPAVQPGPCQAFVGSMDGIVHAFDCATGSPLWSHPTGGPIDASPAIASCGDGCEEVAIGSEDGMMYALDSVAGDQRWATPLDGPIDASAAAAGGMILGKAPTGDGENLEVLDATTGEILAALPVSGPKGPFLDGSTIVVDGAIIPAPSALFHVRTDWEQSHLDAAHDGFQSFDYQLDQQTVGSLAQSWSAGFAASLLGDPKEAGGQVFVGTNNFVTALDAQTAATNWLIASGGEPVYDHGTVYVENGSDLLALNSSNGGTKWDTAVSSGLGPPVADGGIVYGRRLNAQIFLGPVIGGELDAYDSGTGSPLWSFVPPSDPHTCEPIVGLPAVSDGVVYVGVIQWRASIDYCSEVLSLQVWALDAATGQPIWTYEAAPPGDPFCEGIDVDAPVLPAAVAAGTVYVPFNFGYPAQGGFCDDVTFTGELVALDSSNGQLRYTNDVGGQYTGPVAVAYARVYVGTSGGIGGDCLYVLGIFSPITLWTKCTPTHAVHTPAVANGVAYVGSDDGIVYALNAYTGASLGAPFVGGGGALDGSVADGRLFVPTADGHLIAFSI